MEPTLGAGAGQHEAGIGFAGLDGLRYQFCVFQLPRRQLAPVNQKLADAAKGLFQRFPGKRQAGEILARYLEPAGNLPHRRIRGMELHPGAFVLRDLPGAGGSGLMNVK